MIPAQLKTEEKQIVLHSKCIWKLLYAAPLWRCLPKAFDHHQKNLNRAFTFTDNECNQCMIKLLVLKMFVKRNVCVFRYEQKQKILKEELAKVAQKEREAAIQEITKAMNRERQHTRQEAEKTKQLVHTHYTHTTHRPCSVYCHSWVYNFLLS